MLFAGLVVLLATVALLAVPFAGFVPLFEIGCEGETGVVLLAGLVEFWVAFIGLLAFCVEFDVPLNVPFAGLLIFVVLLETAVPLALVVPFVKFRVLFAGLKTLQPHPLAKTKN